MKNSDENRLDGVNLLLDRCSRELIPFSSVGGAGDDERVLVIADLFVKLGEGFGDDLRRGEQYEHEKAEEGTKGTYDAAASLDDTRHGRLVGDDSASDVDVPAVEELAFLRAGEDGGKGVTDLLLLRLIVKKVRSFVCDGRIDQVESKTRKEEGDEPTILPAATQASSQLLVTIFGA